MEIESFQEFIARQGVGDPLMVRNRWLFSNGAQSDGHFSHGDPPDDPTALVRLKLAFVRAET